MGRHNLGNIYTHIPSQSDKFCWKSLQHFYSVIIQTFLQQQRVINSTNCCEFVVCVYKILKDVSYAFILDTVLCGIFLLIFITCMEIVHWSVLSNSAPPTLLHLFPFRCRLCYRLEKLPASSTFLSNGKLMEINQPYEGMLWECVMITLIVEL